MESFWRRVGVEIEFLSPELPVATQNGGFASLVGGGMPPLPSDAKTKVCVRRILCMSYSDFVSWAWGCMPPLGCDAKPWFCVLGMGVLAPP